jgi:hypothetical protein
MKRLLVGLAVLVAVLLPSAPAWAHNLFISSVPAAGSTLTTAPKQVSLRFLQTLNTQYTQITVSDTAKHLVAGASKPAFNRDHGTVTFGRTLANGKYTVAYRTLSIDGHVVQGSFSFTVADPTKPPAPVIAAVAASSSGGGGGIPAPVIAGIAVVAAALLAAASFVYVRSRRNYSPPPADH